MELSDSLYGTLDKIRFGTQLFSVGEEVGWLMGNGVLGVMRLGPWEEGEREEKRERLLPQRGEKITSLSRIFSAKSKLVVLDKIAGEKGSEKVDGG